MLLLPLQWRLISNEGKGARLSFALYHVEQEIIRRNEVAAETAPPFAQESIEAFDALRLVNGIDGDTELRARGKQQPLPVAEMRGKQHDRLPALRAFAEKLRIFDAHPALYFGRARAIAVERFKDQIREIAVRLLQDGRAFGFGFFGKRVAQVRGGERAAPVKYVKRNAKQCAAQFIENRQRQTGEELKQKLHGMDAIRRTAFVLRNVMENGVSVDDFPQPGKLDSPSAAGNVVALPPVASGIELWWAALDRPGDEVKELSSSLSIEELARARRFGTETLSQRWIVGRATLRLLLGRALGIAPSAVALARGRRGRPELAEASIDFNVSHTCGKALIGIGDALPPGLRIGVDVEHGERSVNADGLSRKFLSEHEQALLAPMTAEQRRREFLRLWTCKEAMSKATGDALSAPFRRLHVSIDEGLALVAGPPPYLPADWALHAAAVPDGFLATVAVWRSDRSSNSRSS